jgi:hypothetical protein
MYIMIWMLCRHAIFRSDQIHGRSKSCNPEFHDCFIALKFRRFVYPDFVFAVTNILDNAMIRFDQAFLHVFMNCMCSTIISSGKQL